MGYRRALVRRKSLMQTQIAIPMPRKTMKKAKGKEKKNENNNKEEAMSNRSRRKARQQRRRAVMKSDATTNKVKEASRCPWRDRNRQQTTRDENESKAEKPTTNHTR